MFFKDYGEVMKSWIAGAAAFVFVCVALVVCSPVFTGTWIVKSNASGPVRAVVLTVGIAKAGPVLQIRKVSAAREGQPLYDAIHDAANVPKSNEFSMDDASTKMTHWGGGTSWCDQDDCHRLYIVVGSSLSASRSRHRS